jgi:hypothetical protein
VSERGNCGGASEVTFFASTRASSGVVGCASRASPAVVPVGALWQSRVASKGMVIIGIGMPEF